MKNNYAYAAEMISMILIGEKHMRCEYATITADYIQGLRFPELVRDNRGNQLIPGDQYMIVTCDNSYKYYVNVSGDSVVTACAELLNFIQYK